MRNTSSSRPVVPARPRPARGTASPGRPPTAGPVRRAGPLVVWLVALVSSALLFHALGRGALAAPPLDPSAWSAWADGRDPLVATVAVLRLLVLALCWYLVGVTTVGLVARVGRLARLVRVADACNVPALRRALQSALGATLATAVVVAAAPAHASADPAPARPRSHLAASDVVSAADAAGSPSLDRHPARAFGAAGAGDDRGGTVTLRPDRRLPPLLDRRRHGVTPPSAPAVDAVERTHVIRSGDSLWHVAVAALTEHLGRPPSDAEVLPYWRTVIEANRDVLVDPDDPDLVFPGQAMRVPSPAGDG